MSEMIFKENCKVAIFKAPESDNYRQVVMDYMMKMANITWTPKETFSIKWKGEPRFPINLVYEKGKTYHGMTYTDTKGTLDMFEQLLEDGEMTPNSEYYDECFGNHCSASMIMSYQQILDFPFRGLCKPNSARGTMLKLVGNLHQTLLVVVEHISIYVGKLVDEGTRALGLMLLNQIVEDAQ